MSRVNSPFKQLPVGTKTTSTSRHALSTSLTSEDKLSINSRSIAKHSYEFLLHSLFHIWRSRCRTLALSRKLAAKLGSIKQSQFLHLLVSKWYHETLAPCPFGSHVDHVNPVTYTHQINQLLTRHKTQSNHYLLSLCMSSWKLSTSQRIARLGRQSEVCMSMIDQRERAILSLSLANWNRLLDDIRMGRAAKRIRSDGEKIKQLQSLYDSEISKSNHIIDMYGKLVSHSTKESKLGKAFYHWLIKSQRIIYRQALIVIEELKKKTKLMSHSLLEDNAQNETSNQPPLHFAEEFISLKSEQTEYPWGTFS